MEYNLGGVVLRSGGVWDDEVEGAKSLVGQLGIITLFFLPCLTCSVFISFFFSL